MPRSIWTAVVLVTLAASARLMGAEGPPAAAADASRLAWMQGHWTGSKDGVGTEEHWTSPAGGALVGMHKEVTGGRMTSFEFLRIDASGGGGLAYHASPRSAPPTPFRLIEIGAQRVVFENRDHDFPQRILYWLDATGVLHARIEGTLAGQAQHEEWAWTKAR